MNGPSREYDHPRCLVTSGPLEEGNIFSVVGRARTVLKRAGYSDMAEEMTRRVREARSYEEAIAVVLLYVDDADEETMATIDRFQLAQRINERLSEEEGGE